MPLAAAFNVDVLVPAAVQSQNPDGTLVWAFDYDDSDPVEGRLEERSARMTAMAFGEALYVDAVIIIDFNENPDLLTTLKAGTSPRMQVRTIDEDGDQTDWELVRATNLGNVDRFIEIEVRKWVGSPQPGTT